MQNEDLIENKRVDFLKKIDDLLELGVRQDAIAKALGVTPTTVYCWVTKRQRVGKLTIEAKSKKLHKMWSKVGDAFSQFDIS